eukprot:12091389-Prorocentrum_lima.AAC.1
MGPAHAVLTEIALVRLSHAAGLQLDTHSCQYLHTTDLHPAALRAWEGLPYKVEPTEGGFHIQG